MPAIPSTPRARAEELLDALRRYGSDAVSFLALESRMRHWRWESPDGSSRAVVAYADTGGAWVAIGSPLAAPSHAPAVAKAFVESARRSGRRACFFASEAAGIEGFRPLLLGEQPVWSPAAWPATLAAHRRLREQLRRARSKGVAVRRVHARELEPGTRLRAQVDELARAWLRSRRMAPMSFLVSLELFHMPEEHRYFVAERGGQILEFLSAVPVYAGDGWLVEDVLRGGGAPNGTTEALVDAVMRDVAASRFLTLGLAPLSGEVSPWLRAARFVSSPMFDFAGLRAFRQRLRPARWQRVWLLCPDGEPAGLHVVDSLRAFAGGSLLAFALRSAARRPSGPPWALALPLVPWTALLAALVVSGRSEMIGFSRVALAWWVAFDALLGVELFRSAQRPRRLRFALVAAAAAADAVFSLAHVRATGLGPTAVDAALRSVAALAPCLGAAVLAWIALLPMHAVDR